MRLYRLDVADVERLLRDSIETDFDETGNTRMASTTLDGRTIIVVVAADDPRIVVTLFERNRA